LIVGPYAARALVAIGERRQATELAEKVMPPARRWAAPSTVAHALRTVAAAHGGDEGVRRLEEAVALMAGSPRRLQHAQAYCDLGAALRVEGCRVDARPPLREALELARRCGAVRLAKRAREELEATGETVRRYKPIGAESLTPRERRAAELAASGMTNRQIAQSLFVTVKTVESHLSAAYDKLDIDSRQGLAAALGGAE
jgi:DNA-binding CsgD family transcriptional regulator